MTGLYFPNVSSVSSIRFAKGDDRYRFESEMETHVYMLPAVAKLHTEISCYYSSFNPNSASTIWGEFSNVQEISIAHK